MEKAAIFGAAGAIGPWVAEELSRRGIPFRTVGRSRAKLEAAFAALPHAEIFDAESPFEPRGCIAQAWGTAEWLRALDRASDTPRAPALPAKEERPPETS